MVETELTETPDLLPGARLGPYVIVSKLTQGGFGAVYLANDPRLEGLQVIIKTMLVASPEMRALFRQEARRLVDL
ncbi:MAG: serine/threonine protein kinase, partial [Archangium sp.]|nr:serine/threonine protein kinase [Archangium sp.]